MELDGNNGINFYKQVAPTGLLRKISFSCQGVSKPLIMNRLLYVWCMHETDARGPLPEFAACLVAHDGGAIDYCELRCNERSVENGK